jgi:acyl carrier protein
VPALTQHDVRALLQRFLANEVLFASSPSLDPTQSLSELGVLDSTTVLEIIAFIEDEFHVVVSLEGVISETFDTLDNITETVMAHLNAHATVSIEASEIPDSR